MLYGEDPWVGIPRNMSLGRCIGFFLHQVTYDAARSLRKRAPLYC